MRKTIYFMMFLLLCSFVVAQEGDEGLSDLSGGVVDVVVPADFVSQDDLDLAGVGPNNFFWGVDLAFDRLTELFSEEAKLRHSQERLAEVRVMLSLNRISDAGRAVDAFNRVHARVLDKSVLVDDKFFVDNLGQRIRSIASVRMGLNQSDVHDIKGLIDAHRAGFLNRSGGRDLNVSAAGVNY